MQIEITIIVSLLVGASLVIVVDLPRRASAYIPHSPILIDGNDNFTSANGVIGGSGTSSDPYIIEGWEINTTLEHGVHVRNTDAYFVIRDMYVHSSELIYSGIYFNNASNGVVSNVTLSNNGCGIHARFSTNTFVSVSSIWNNGEGVSLWLSANTTITDNSIFSNYGPGISSDSSTNTTITDNSIFSNSWAGIFLDSSNEATIASNNISDNLDGIHLWSSTNTTMTANNISSNSRYGACLRRSIGTIVTNNTLANDGILLDGLSVSHYNTHTIAADNSVNGLPLYYYKDCSSLTLDGLPVGQLIVANCTNVSASNLTIRNADVGIEIAFVKEGAIRRCDISNNLYSVYLDASVNVTVYHNDFTNNTAGALDNMGPENKWHNGYPSGGNYWSDYTGMDNKSGPNQDQPGSDGIGDTPQSIDADSQDRYPLMRPYSTVPPQPPTALNAELSGTHLENVTITWSLSADDGTGLRSVIGYDIYRNATFDPEGLDYQLIGAFPNGTSAFVDSVAGEGDPSDYFYRICAIDMYNNTSCGTEQAAKFTRPFTPGPNPVSIPLILSNESIETVLQTVEFDKAWNYDSSSQEWKWYMTSKDYRRGLWNINHTMGLWINVTQDSNLTVAGVVPAQTTIHLHEGWNLVSFPSFNTTYMVLDLKAEVGATRVEGYDSAPPNFLRVLGDTEVLQAGYGYWVRVEADIDWIVEVS